MKIMFLLLLIPLRVFAMEEYVLIIQDHKFIPDKLIIPADKKIKLVIYNKDNEVEEFESFDLRREKIVPAQGQIKLNIGPLEPGEYKFFGDFHNEIAKGVIVVN